jgi:glycyl-tRNA synthetase beta chain
MTDTNKNKAADLLIELGCEELPPKALDTIRDAFFRAVCEGLDKNALAFSKDKSRSFSTPRRITLLLSSVASGQADQELNRRGPSVSAAFDEAGNPTGAATGFARSVGLEVSELDTLKTDKGEWLYCKVNQKGKPLDDLIYEVLEKAIKQLPVPKPMRWADHEFSFVRPVHWLVVLHGDRVVDGELFGLKAGRMTRGHRIHSPGPHTLENAGQYVDVLKKACVLADHEERKALINTAVLEAEADALVDPALLAEVNNLVEWPVAVVGSFEEDFLRVPHSALIASMQDHQKFFPVCEADDKSRVTNRFVAVSNIDSNDFSQVRAGYERVIRPRLADARFFLDQDSNDSLESHLALLDRVVFQQKIGTVGDKSRRIAAVSKKIADYLSVDVHSSERAALLSKCDLMTQMVGEFPELQGEMGRHYAIASGETPVVATAIGEHYAPRFAGDLIPATDAGRIVSIADRADSLVGIFAAGLKPSGNKDPFALRRAALGLLRILLESKIALEPRKILEWSADSFQGQVEVSEKLLDEVFGFIVERMRHYFTERGFLTELVNAALASPWTDLPDLERRLSSINEFMKDEAASSLAASNKRIGNILRKSDFEDTNIIDPNLFSFDEERCLFDEINRIGQNVDPLLKAGQYEQSLRLLSGLKDPVDRFFDAVMVMDKDPVLRNNRLALLALLKSRFDHIADLSILG